MIRILLWPLGVFFVLLGVAGIVLPILPGWALLFVGLSMIAPRLASTIRARLSVRFLRAPIVSVHAAEGMRCGFTTKHAPLRVSSSEDFMQDRPQFVFEELFRKQEPKISVRTFAFLRQVHGGNVSVIGETIGHDRTFLPIPESDGAVTNLPGVALLAFSADCLPIFFWTQRAGRADWIGIAHAGWRGTSLEVAVKTLKLLCFQARCTPADVNAAFGPCIRRYEVGKEFLDRFPASSFRKQGSKLFFDLPRENRRQLVQAGLNAKNVHDTGFCTVASNRHVPSFRVEGQEATRTVSYIVKERVA